MSDLEVLRTRGTAPSYTRPSPPAGAKQASLRSCAIDFSAGLGIVAPILSLWYVRLAVGQRHDRAFMADHAAVPARVVSVDPSSDGRSAGSADTVVLAFQPPSGTPCRVTWQAARPGFTGAPGETLTVVPRSADCVLPLIPSRIGDPVQTFALAAALMAGGLACLKAWAWLFRHPPLPAWSRRRDLA